MRIERKVTPSTPKRVLLIGWDAADWQMIHPLIEQGLMPTTAALMQRGAWGNIATTRPILSPMLWNTIATGKRPQHHGILGFTEPNDDGSGVRPAASTSRKCKALWNILTQSGLKSNVVGWYASHPAEPIDGVMVSNQFEHCAAPEGQFQSIPTGAIHPATESDELAEFRIHPAEIDATAILPFVPRAAELITKYEQRLGKLQQMVAQTSTIHAVATHLMTNREWDFTAIYYEGIDRFGHEFMQFHPPKLREVGDEEFEAFQHCMVGIYRFHDMLLETLLKIAGPDTAVILMSDHGYYNNHLRPDPREGKSGPVEWHRPFGILALSGAGIQPGARVYGASILDVAPTVLQLLGLPAAYDMPGRVLAEALVDRQPLERIESWEEIEGDSGLHPQDMRIDPAESREAMRQLVELGYIEPPSNEASQAIEQCIASNQLNLAQSLADSRDFRGAIDVLERLPEDARSSPSIRILLAFCLLGTNQRDQARTILESLQVQGGASPRIYMMLGSIAFADGDSEAALRYLEQVRAADSRLPGLHSKLGEVYLETGRHQLAVESFDKALEYDAESPIAFAGLARAKLEMGDPQAALENGLIAAELVHHFPRAHLVIGKALVALGDYGGAVEALELCIKQSPRMESAHRALATAYRNLGETQKAIAAELRARSVLA